MATWTSCCSKIVYFW